jgi:hypothetical protein
MLNLDGRFLANSATHPSNSNHRISDEALLWHFEQAVLKNVRATGEQWPDWEYDLGERGDIITEISQGPNPEERMELELFTRLASHEVSIASCFLYPANRLINYLVIVISCFLFY